MTHRPNPVQSIAQHRQQFSQPQYQSQQQVWQAPPPQQQQMPGPEQQIQSQMHELSLEIFARLAVDHLRGDVDPEYLDVLAGRSQTAARVYFEQLGIQFNGEQNNGGS